MERYDMSRLNIAYASPEQVMKGRRTMNHCCLPAAGPRVPHAYGLQADLRLARSTSDSMFVRDITNFERATFFSLNSNVPQETAEASWH